MTTIQILSAALLTATLVTGTLAALVWLCEAIAGHWAKTTH